MTEGKGSSASFWLAGIVVLITVGGLLYAFRPRPEPDYVIIQSIYIACPGTPKAAPRSQADAHKLALETLQRAERGEDFSALGKTLPDPGDFETTSGIWNRGAMEIRPGSNYDQITFYRRNDLVPAVGDLGFKLRVKGVGLVPYDPRSVPSGWMIIKRLE